MKLRKFGPLSVALTLVLVCAGIQVPGDSAASTGSSHAGEARQQSDESGDEDFYRVSGALAQGPHGSVIRARKLSGSAALPGAENWQVLYRSVTPEGQSVAVSGTVAIPRGRAPEKGWPVLSWGHGTTGVTDACAPSRDTPAGPAHGYLGLMDQTLAKWIERGYAVVQTDYQGLGTPGDHGYLIGSAEARASADIVRAANELSDRLSPDWVVAGHSQGGQAALFAAAQGQDWTPELNLRAAVAVAAPSRMTMSLPAARRMPLDGAAFFPLIIRGVQTATNLRTEEVLTPKARDMLRHTDDRCIEQLREPDSWAGMKTNEVFQPGADMRQFDKVIRDNDASGVHPRVPVLLAQGGKDQEVQHYWTGLLYAQLRALGADVSYRFYPEADHRGSVAASYADAGKWVDGLVHGTNP